MSGRWELFRALAAVIDTPPRESRAVVRALDLPPLDAAEHTATFVLWCQPFAALHLGPEGKLGGVAADRVAGFWRALGLTPPPSPDHLAHLLTLYAHLGEAGQDAGERMAQALGRARAALLQEHLWSWVPGYLAAVEDLGGASLAPWAALTRRALRQDVRASRQAVSLPLALREAPPPLATGSGVRELLDMLLAPVRSGIVLTHPSLAAIARAGGTGYRAGERRFALQAMLDQDTAGTLEGLAAEAHRWAGRHSAEAAVEPRVAGWWTARARAAETVLASLAKGSRPGRRDGPAFRRSPPARSAPARQGTR